MKRFKNILFVFESALGSRIALERAITLAENNQAQLTVIEVIKELPFATGAASDSVSPETLQEAMLEELREKLESLVVSIRKGFHVNTKVRVGTLYLEIIREALEGQRDLVMKSAHGGGALDRIFGHNDMRLLRKCPCPVWLTKPTEAKPYRRILAAVDSGEKGDREKKNSLNQQILEMATSLAHSEFSELHVVHVWRVNGESSLPSASGEDVRRQHLQWLNGLMDDLTTWVGKDAFDYVKPQIHLLDGNAQDEIPRLAEELQLDLIVMGTLGRARIPGFTMGGTAETILNRIDCSVLVVKPEGFVTPVMLES